MDKQRVLEAMGSCLDLILNDEGTVLDLAHAYIFLAYFLEGAPEELRLNEEFTDPRLSSVGQLSLFWAGSLRANSALAQHFITNGIVAIDGSAGELADQTATACKKYFAQFHEKIMAVVAANLPLTHDDERKAVAASMAAHFVARNVLMATTGRTGELLRRIDANDMDALSDRGLTGGFTYPVLMDQIPRIAGWSETMHGDASRGVCAGIFVSIVEDDLQLLTNQIYADWDEQQQLTLTEAMAVDAASGAVTRNLRRGTG
ncbi:hypothetical protein [Pseudoxanthomonas winnipegensis]|uniref:hypothetical protein n=1 Tax=Pseudoxanthomonas winnipegensis TaxID=2480810 RepID=UPI00103E1584|nr:hypothetical protein [Pseudoxanthomonas winnipegensis]TBV69773.1 hypothetical protein EYC45_19180 [Pseudoxanthomonas winnipegensis]